MYFNILPSKSLPKKEYAMRGIIIIEKTTALIRRVTALNIPIKQSKKKLKYKNTLNALKYQKSNAY
jgi:hypothetical protein